ncbi:MAG: tetratricopeptide repeat protein [Candidatus Sericytochromatia bacterium]
MQALSALKELQAQRQQLQGRRQSTAQNHYDTGLKALSQAIESNFRDKKALGQALESWMEAMRNNRRDPEPCSGLGYIFLLLGDTRMAIRYFQAALAIDPQHADSRRWLDHIQAQIGQSPAKPVLSRPSTTASFSDDPEVELQQVEEELFQLLKQWMEQPMPAPGKAMHKTIVKHQQFLTETCGRIQAQLKRLEEDLDTGQVQHRLLALETLERRYQSHLKRSELFIAMEVAMAEELAKVKGHLELLESGMPGPSPADIEFFLDQCDRFADQQDEWDQQGYDISALESTYQKLVQELEKLQDRLDEL